MSRANEAEWREFFSQARGFIYSLQNDDGERLCESRTKTGFIGFLIAVRSFEDIFEDLVGSGRLQHILTYRWSQDHLEIFFSGIQATLECNNNPTVRQFNSSMKKLLVQTDIWERRGQNCEDNDVPDVSGVRSSSKWKKPLTVPQYESLPGDKTFKIDPDVENWVVYSAYKKSVIHYITSTSLVSKMALRSLKCRTCISFAYTCITWPFPSAKKTRLPMVHSFNDGSLAASPIQLTMSCSCVSRRRTILTVTSHIPSYRPSLFLPCSPQSCGNVLSRDLRYLSVLTDKCLKRWQRYVGNGEPHFQSHQAFGFMLWKSSFISYLNIFLDMMLYFCNVLACDYEKFKGMSCG